MPNWCNNTVTIYNEDKSKIDMIEVELQKGDECKLFQTLHPMPLAEEENWYEWNVNNWGTKWDASVWDWSRDDDNRVTISFDTAWSPPTTLYEFLEFNGYGIDAMYHEPGMCFAGIYDTEQGGDDYYNYDLADLESIESMPERLVDFGGLMEAHQDWKDENEEEVD